MPHNEISATPERSQVLDDNARKFTLLNLDSEMINDAPSTKFTLTVDWLDTAEDTETKLAYKEFDSGEVQILLINKVTNNGTRTAVKEKITKERYDELLGASTLHLVKRRYEFEYSQHDMVFNLKYDEFEGNELRVLEVDAATDEQREAFNPTEFPAELVEVTGDMQYYGYRVAEMLQDSTG